MLKMMRMGAQVEQLETGMNKAAEAAVPQAQALLLEAVKKMSVADAKAVLAGGHDWATQCLNKKRFQGCTRCITEKDSTPGRT